MIPLLKLTCRWEGRSRTDGELFCRCGYATLHHVIDKSKEDRMESFFLSETCKYLYLVGVLPGASVTRACWVLLCAGHCWLRAQPCRTG